MMKNIKKLYNDYLEGKIDLSKLDRNDFNTLLLESFTHYQKNGGEQSFKQFIGNMNNELKRFDKKFNCDITVY